jgi:mono/diheme cytochrome c family protein
MTLEGRWRIEVEVRRPNEDDVRAFFDVRPAGSAAATVRRGGEWDNPAPGMSWNEFGGFAVLALALFVAVFRRYGTRFRQPFGLASSGASVLGFGVGFLLLFGVHGHQPIQGLPANPTFPDDNSIQKGREIYQRNCAACHGTAGVPPKGLKLEPYPLDLTVHVPQHPDGQIFVFIREGLEGTAMRAWGRGDNRLSDEQIWDVVNYLRTLGGVTE